MPPAIPSRTLRCANAALYLALAVGTAGAAAWAAARGHLSSAGQQGIAAAAALIALLWGGYYALLRYEIDSIGITRRLIGSRRTYPWEQLLHAELTQTSAQGIASCCICLHFREAGELRISSDLFSLDDVEQLRDDLASTGWLSDTKNNPF